MTTSALGRERTVSFWRPGLCRSRISACDILDLLPLGQNASDAIRSSRCAHHLRIKAGFWTQYGRCLFVRNVATVGPLTSNQIGQTKGKDNSTFQLFQLTLLA